MLHWLWEVIAIALGDFVGGSMTGIIVLVVFAVIWYGWRWHRNQIRNGKKGVEPAQLVIGGLVLLIVGAGATIGGIIWWTYSRHETATATHNPSDLNAILELKQKVAEDERILVDAQQQIKQLSSYAHVTPGPPYQIINPVESVAPQAQTGPINWNLDGQFIVGGGYDMNALVNAIMLQGTSKSSLSIKEAYAISGMTGRKQAFMANVAAKGYFPVDAVDIPPDAPVGLDMVFNPVLSVREFLEQWGKLKVTIVYADGETFEHDFDENYVRQKVQAMVPGAFGPRVTPRNEK